MKNLDRILNLQGVLNARELGGLPLTGGKTVKHGKIIRTGRLSNLTVDDRKLLKDVWNVTRIVDLRNNREIAEYPDMELEGAVYQQIAIIPGEKEGISREDHGMDPIDRAIIRAENLHKNGGAKGLLEGMYGQMACDDYCIDRIKDFFDMMLEHDEGAFIWHCTSGKDRTGVTGALILYALGADMETIKEDYLYTNQQNRQYRGIVLDKMRAKNASDIRVEEIRILESVDWAYIESFMDGVTKKYGSVDAFLSDRLQLDCDKIAILKNKYTE
ncbi:MAG: tyrosine-protein phosphatase [Oscillospiraceae bacterium]|nr:tyrosine-protein phosphatase [Oscillospiraceae bacterium]